MARGNGRPRKDRPFLSPLHAGLPRLRPGSRRFRRRHVRLPREERNPRQHCRDLHFRPRVLPRRPRAIRQALHHGRGRAHAFSRALPRDHRAGKRQLRHRDEHRLLADVPRHRGRAEARPHAGRELPRKPQGAHAGIMARGLLHALLCRRRRTCDERVVWHPHEDRRARFLLQA